MIIIYITILLFVPYALLIFYYRNAWIAIPETLYPAMFVPNTKISVIIPARNEEKNIGACLHSMVQQDYPEHLVEFIVVNDFSNDKTEDVVRAFKIENIRLINLADEFGKEDISNSYKKKAIETGIKKSIGTLIVCTDADCIAGQNWLKAIAFYYEQNQPVFIAAPVGFYNDNNPLQIFQSLDFLSLQGITGGSVYKQIHTMCNGANLAYERKVFDEVDGFKGIDQIASGDDMLLMHKIFQRYPEKVMYMKSRAAIMQTKPADSPGEFFDQRIRWASKATKFDDKRIFWVLVLVYFFNLSLFAVIISSFFIPSFWIWIGGFIFSKFLVEMLFMLPVSKFFGKKKLLWFFLPAQPFHILYTVVAGLFGQFGSYRWKGRRVK